MSNDGKQYGLTPRDWQLDALQDDRTSVADQARIRHDILAKVPKHPKPASMRADERQAALIRQAYSGIRATMGSVVRDGAGWLFLRVDIVPMLRDVFGGADHFLLPLWTTDEGEAARRLTTMGHAAETVLATAIVDRVDATSGTDPRFKPRA